MYYSFAPYEQDFRAWWQSGAFPEVNPLTRDFLLHLTRKDAPRKLWRHQEEAVMAGAAAEHCHRRRQDSRHRRGDCLAEDVP
jgi:hypothetical protein